MKITKEIEEANLVTHSSTFHPDDVFSTMFLSKIVDNPVVCRVKNIDREYKNKYIYDIGFGKFDHHQKDAKWRNDKIKYSSFGLLWQEYGKKYLEGVTTDYEDIFKRIDNKLVCQIDGIDNGNFPKIEADYELLDLDKIIDLYNNSWDNDIDNDDNFLEAVKMAEIIFDRLIDREISLYKAFKIVSKCIDDMKDNILLLPKRIPYTEAVFASNKDIKAIIYPSNRVGYNIKPTTVSEDSHELKYNFPKEWWGLHDEELAKVSGISTATFIHSTGFIAAAKDLEDAYKLANSLK